MMSKIREASLYWEQVRNNYSAFESDFKGGSSDVYHASDARRSIYQPQRTS